MKEGEITGSVPEVRKGLWKQMYAVLRRIGLSYRRHSGDERSRHNRDKNMKEINAFEEEPKPKKEPLDLLRTRTGGAYIPPAKLRMMQDQISDKEGEQYQRMNWERLKKKIHGLVNKVNTGNLVSVVRSLLQENIIRGKGLLVRSIMQAQAFSPVFSHVYAAFVAVINSKFPHIGELLLRRLIVQFKRSFRRNDKGTTVTVSKFIAHLINQRVAHEVLALEIMILMMETPTDDSVEVSIAFLKECGAKLLEVSPRALDTVFTRLRGILQDGDSNNLDKRVQYMIEVVMTIRKDQFKAYPAVIDELDLIDEEDQITHTISLEDAVNPENELNIFKMDPDFSKNEQQYEEIRAEIIGDADDTDEEGSSDDDTEGLSNVNELFIDYDRVLAGQTTAGSATTEIIDNTEQNLVAFRREVYLTIQSSLDFQEAAHKLLKMKVSKELELCHMLVDCCCQQRTYERFYGLLCERFCRLRKEYQMTFERIACDTYATIHRFDITKLRNMARLISHLLFTDAINWTSDTTSSGRIYLKYIFQELCESMGLAKLYERISDPTLQTAFAGLFPRDNPQNTRFAINFFTLTGLGGLTARVAQWLEALLRRAREMRPLPTKPSIPPESANWYQTCLGG
uniref:Lethal protein 858 n=1 Tax=Angiostrongylus cantonensis TaxID=6313 RepID=A0A0K0DD65_ANGCA